MRNTTNPAAPSYMGTELAREELAKTFSVDPPTLIKFLDKKDPPVKTRNDNSLTITLKKYGIDRHTVKEYASGSMANSPSLVVLPLKISGTMNRKVMGLLSNLTFINWEIKNLKTVLHLVCITFKDLLMTNCRYPGSRWLHLKFLNSTLDNVSLSKSWLKGSELHKCTLLNTKICSLIMSHSTITDCRISSGRWGNNDLLGVLIKDTQIDGVLYHKGHYQKCHFENVVFKGSTLKKCIFVNVTFKNVKFIDCVLEAVRFKGCDLDQVSWVNVSYLYNSSLMSSLLGPMTSLAYPQKHLASFVESRLNNVRASIPECLDGIYFSKCRLKPVGSFYINGKDSSSQVIQELVSKGSTPDPCKAMFGARSRPS